MVPASVKQAALIQIVKSQIAHSEGVHPDAVTVTAIGFGQVNALAEVECGGAFYAVRVIFGSTVGTGQPEVASAERYDVISYGTAESAQSMRAQRSTLFSRMYGITIKPPVIY